ncbi:hypothetical protein RDI58_002052 [Solanum bulbocastanum]|uniref:Uncharacterized protein n=1 Tax=Solanum bulbocastanum TaxID=147425 RepID=A0AAN8YNN7_SOLBU
MATKSRGGWLLNLMCKQHNKR